MSENIKVKKVVAENILAYIKQEMTRVRYGRIIIELRENSNKIDVVTENRTRFPKEKNSQNG